MSKLTAIKTEAGWMVGTADSDVYIADEGGKPYANRDAARKAAKAYNENAARNDAAIAAAFDQATDKIDAVIADMPEAEAEAPALTLAEAVAEATGEAEEVTIPLDAAPGEVPPTEIEGAGKLPHGLAAEMGIAKGNIGAGGFRKVRPPMKWGGAAHRNMAAWLVAAGALEGTEVGSRWAREHAAFIPTIYGKPVISVAAVGPAWFDTACDAGLLERTSATGGRGTGYVVTAAALAPALPVL